MPSFTASAAKSTIPIKTRCGLFRHAFTNRADALEKDPRIAFIEPDRVVHIFDEQSPAVWGLDRGSARAAGQHLRLQRHRRRRPRLYCRYRHPLHPRRICGAHRRRHLPDRRQRGHGGLQRTRHPCGRRRRRGDLRPGQRRDAAPGARAQLPGFRLVCGRHRRRRLDRCQLRRPGRRQFEPGRQRLGCADTPCATPSRPA